MASPITFADISSALDAKTITTGILSFAGGGIVTQLLGFYRGRVRPLDYTVRHDMVATAGDDPVFGAVGVTWQGNPVTNLHLSVLTLRNDTSTDFSKLKFKIVTGDTVILQQFTSLDGSPFVLNWTDEYANSIRVPDGQQPTDPQKNIYHHSREFVAEVFNRGESITVRLLTTVPPGKRGPEMWLSTLHPGIKARYRPSLPEVHGVPVKVAVLAGLLVSVAAAAAAALFVREPAAVALFCLAVGLFAQFIGAVVVRAARYLRRVLLN